VIVNTCVRADGTTGTILSKPLYQHKMAAGAVYRAELTHQLEERLGIVLERDPGAFDFRAKGVPESLVTAFSKRRQQVEKALSEYGASGAKAAAKFTLLTRPAKAHLPREQLVAAWREVGRAHGLTMEGINSLWRKMEPRKDELASRINTCIEAAVEKITRKESHFPERELVRHAAIEAQTMGIPAAELCRVIKERLTSPREKLCQTRTSIQSDSRVKAPESSGLAAAITAANKASEFVCLGRSRDEIRYTTKKMLDLEKKLLDDVDKLKNAQVTRALPDKTIKEVDGQLSDEQKSALRHVTQSEGSIHVVSGLAGTGKTSMLKAARKAFQSEGFEVIGACLAGKAAQGLEDGAGIKSTTIAKLVGIPERGFVGDLEKARAGPDPDAMALLRKRPEKLVRLSPNTILVVDEAGMVPLCQMERLTDEVRRAGARLILCGDEQQLSAIESGGAFASIGRRIGRATLSDIQRQRDPWAREMVRSFGGNHGPQALCEYMNRGLVSVMEDRTHTVGALINSWSREGIKKPKDNLILASTNAEIAELNKLAQNERIRAGELGPDHLSVAGQEFYRGDRVLFTRNSKRFGVQNGSLGTVVGMGKPRGNLIVRLDNRPFVSIPVKDYTHMKLGYAMTTHKSQGVTTENSYVLLGGPNQDRELTYVQASRARGTTRFFIDRLEAGDEMRDICKELERSSQKELAHDLLERKERGYMESRNILIRKIE